MPKKAKKTTAKKSSVKDPFALMGALAEESELKAIELETKKAEDFLSTGCLGLDLALGGGYYGGQVIQFYGPEHSGKCLVKTSMVHTADGLKTISEVFDEAGHPTVSANRVVEVAVPLVNRYGQTERCSRLFMNGKKPVTRLTTETGGQIESTANHPHLVMSESGNWVWRRTKQLRPGDYLIRSTAPSFGTEKVSDVDAYLVGVLAADGYFSDSRVSITNDDPSVIEAVLSVGPALLKVDPKSYDRTSDSVSFHFNSTDGVSQFYETWGVEPGTAAFKRVPTRVRRLTKDGVTAFLRGYFDCESFADNTGIEVSSASFDLLHDVKLLLQAVGIIGVITKKTAPEYPDSDYWRMHITGQDFRLFVDEVQTRSEKVRDRYTTALDFMAEREENTHKHSIPHLGPLLRDLYDSCAETTREDNRLFGDVMGASPRTRLTYKRLQEILARSATPSWNQALRNILVDIQRAGYFYDRIESVEDAGEQPVFDLEMPETHSFIANGLVTHNSTMGYSSAAYLTSLGITVGYLDFEGTTDRAYTEQPGIGVDYSKVHYFRPKTGEKGYDFIYNFCDGLDDKHSGLPQAVIFVDTIAAMLPQVWVDDPTNKQPGRDAAMHSLGWKRIQTLITNKHVSIVAMNQIRANVGNPYQAPENLPGGNAWKFATTNLVRVGRGKTIELPNGDSLQLMRFKTQKNKNFLPLQEAQIHLNLGYGIDVASDVVVFCKMAGYYKRHGNKLPHIVVGDIDEKFSSLAVLEETLRREGREGAIYQACREALRSGEAIARYRASKNKMQDESEDVSTLGARREKAKHLGDDHGGDEDDFEHEEPTEDVSAASEPEPEEDETPAALGKQRKKKTAKKKAAKKRRKKAKKKTTK